MEPIQLSGCAIIKEGKLLLLWKNKHSHYEFPGGKVNPGENLEDAARRETKEEIACDVEIMRYDGYKQFTIEGRIFQSHKFLAAIVQGQEPRIMEPNTFRDIFWLPIRGYAQYSVAPNVKEFCDDYIAGRMS